MQIETILFPTDFSASSTVALNFATAIAETFYAKLVVVHINMSNQAQKSIPGKRKKTREQLDDLKFKIVQKNALLNVTTIDTDGSKPSALLEFIEKESADLIVIGTPNSEGIKGALTGTFASVILERATCPVLVVPEKSKKGLKFSRIAYAGDLEHFDITAIRELTEFATYYNAEVTILSLSEKNRRFSEEQLFHFEKQVRENAGYPKLDFIYMYGHDINYHVEEYINRNPTDLMVISIIKDSLINQVLHDKNKARLNYHDTLPLLTFHESDKCCQKIS